MKKPMTLVFLATELILYLLIMTTEGATLVWSSYLSIVTCFLYALTGHNGFITGGLACTVAADFFLVVCSPIQQLWGMVCFLGAQTLYALMLHRARPNKTIVIVRMALTVLAEAVTLTVLKGKTDALAVISICYYANLIVNIAAAFALWKKNKLLPIAFVLFLLCDTVIGLQAASGVYLPIGKDSLLYRILFMDFNLAWFFYLPSQILIALSGKNKRTGS